MAAAQSAGSWTTAFGVVGDAGVATGPGGGVAAGPGGGAAALVHARPSAIKRTPVSRPGLERVCRRGAASAASADGLLDRRRSRRRCGHRGAFGLMAPRIGDCSSAFQLKAPRSAATSGRQPRFRCADARGTPLRFVPAVLGDAPASAMKGLSVALLVAGVGRSRVGHAHRGPTAAIEFSDLMEPSGPLGVKVLMRGLLCRPSGTQTVE